MRKGNRGGITPCHSCKAILLISGILLFLPCGSSLATLIICVYNNSALYIGSDSLVTQQGTNSVFLKKIFWLGNTCCVSIANSYGGFVQDVTTGRISLLFLPKELESACSNSRHVTQRLQSTITNVVGEFSLKYNDYMRRKLPERTNDQDLSTRLCFWGYDDSRKTFFGSSCKFDGTNRTTLETVFERGAKSIGPNVLFQGEGQFLSAFIPSQERQMVALRSHEFTNTIAAIQAESPLPEDRVANCMLEMFHLHKEYAPLFSSEKGWIGEPYVIYKIMKEKTVQLH